MTENHLADQRSRRRALKILVGTASAAASLPVIGEGAARVAGPVCHMAIAAAELPTYHPQFFGTEQIRTLEALSETIIPADEHSPGAKAARVWEYIDAIIVDADESARSLWTQGLAAVDRMAEREYQKAFADCAPDEQVGLVEKIARN